MAMVIEIVVLLLFAVISTLTVFGVRKAAVVLLEEYDRTHPVVRRQRKYKWETDLHVSLPSVLSDPRCVDQMHIPRSKHSK